MSGDHASLADDLPPWDAAVTRRGASAALAPYQRRLRTFDGGQAVAPNVTTVPLTGHTPGHSGYRVGSGAEAILVVGDIVHVPAVQGPCPDASVVFDVDPAAAVSARIRLFEEAAREGIQIAGAHTEFPGVSVVSRVDGKYQLIPDLWVGAPGA